MSDLIKIPDGVQKIDESKLPLDLQAVILTGMNFNDLCEYVATHIT